MSINPVKKLSRKSGEGQAKAGRGGNVPPEKYRWKKGQSGNPKGMPPHTESQKQLRELLVLWFNETDKKGKSNLRKQIEKLAKVRSEKGARLLLEYGFGKVKEEVDINGQGELLVRVVYGNKGANGGTADSSPATE